MLKIHESLNPNKKLKMNNIYGKYQNILAISTLLITR